MGDVTQIVDVERDVVVASVGKPALRHDPRRKRFHEQAGVGGRHDLVAARRDHERWHGHPRSVPNRLEPVGEQEPHRQIGKQPPGDRQDAVEGCHQHEPMDGPRRRQPRRQCRAQAPADDVDLSVLPRDEVEDRRGVPVERGLRRPAAAAAVAAVVQRIDGTVGEGDRQFGHRPRHVLGIATEVQDRPRAVMRLRCDPQADAGHVERGDRAAACRRHRVEEKRPLHEEQRAADHDIDPQERPRGSHRDAFHGLRSRSTGGPDPGLHVRQAVGRQSTATGSPCGRRPGRPPGRRAWRRSPRRPRPSCRRVSPARHGRLLHRACRPAPPAA